MQCDVCDCWVHQICGLFNKGRNKEETPYVCPMCLLDGAHTHHLLAHMLPCNDLPHSLLGALQWSLKCPGYETLPTSRAVQLCKNTWLGMRIWGAVTHAPRKWWCACSPDAISDPGWQRELIGVVAGCRAEAGPAEGNCGAAAGDAGGQGPAAVRPVGLPGEPRGWRPRTRPLHARPARRHPHRPGASPMNSLSACRPDSGKPSVEDAGHNRLVI